MAIRAYVFKYNYSAPFAIATGMPHKPTAMRTKNFRKGEIINAEIKHHNNKPAIILYNGVVPIPLEAVKQVVTKEVISSADGTKSAIVDSDGVPEKKVKVNTQHKKLRTIDAAIVGGIVGFAGVYWAEKKGYITPDPSSNMKYKIMGAVAGAALLSYVAYRFQNKPKVVVAE